MKVLLACSWAERLTMEKIACAFREAGHTIIFPDLPDPRRMASAVTINGDPQLVIMYEGTGVDVEKILRSVKESVSAARSVHFCVILPMDSRQSSKRIKVLESLCVHSIFFREDNGRPIKDALLALMCSGESRSGKYGQLCGVNLDDKDTDGVAQSRYPQKESAPAATHRPKDPPDVPTAIVTSTGETGKDASSASSQAKKVPRKFIPAQTMPTFDVVSQEGVHRTKIRCAIGGNDIVLLKGDYAFLQNVILAGGIKKASYKSPERYYEELRFARNACNRMYIALKNTPYKIRLRFIPKDGSITCALVECISS